MAGAMNLHDATLSDLRLDWAQGECFVRVSPVGSSKDGFLVFAGVREVGVPRKNPWGHSASINQFREPSPGTFEIEMQSGDILKVVATTWRFEGEGAP